jgi:uncharacterized damage-inducible protein DinB
MEAGTTTERCAAYLGEYLGKIRFCVERMADRQVWWRPAPHVNSTGNLLLHLTGNLSQWVLEGLGGLAYERHRDAEFAATGGATRDELLSGLAAVVEKSQAVIRGLSAEELRRERRIQGEDTDGLGVVLHVTEHMAYHTGQAVQLAKQILGSEAPIDFYPQHRGE